MGKGDINWENNQIKSIDQIQNKQKHNEMQWPNHFIFGGGESII